MILVLEIGPLARSRRQALAAGADLFLPQPAEQQELEAGVTTLLDRAAGNTPTPARGPKEGNGA